jgi:hypothetical protein
MRITGGRAKGKMGMRNVLLQEILTLLKETPINYDLKPWNEWSNKELLQFYGDLRIDIETEEYYDDIQSL